MFKLLQLSILSLLFSWFMTNDDKLFFATSESEPEFCNCDTERDRQILIDLYNATDGDNWQRKDNWLSDAPIREWEGVTPSTEGCVRLLVLNGNGLNGTIPASIGDLQQLERLDLRQNELTGVIPLELGNLSGVRFRKLDLSANQLSGTIPDTLRNLQSLTDLFLGDNNLIGEIPSWIGDLSKLNQLGLSENNFVGEIPPELGNLSNLVRIGLGKNQLTGSIPPELGNLDRNKLMQLSLRQNQLSGCYPLSLRDFCTQYGGLLNFGNAEDTLDGYDFTGNPMLPWQGDFTHFCEGEEQIGAPCDNGNPATVNDTISQDCACMGVPCRFRDSLALVELYISTDGDNWTDSWNLAQPINTWTGVALNEYGCVAQLNLNNNELAGTLPINLGELQSLELLDLRHNELTGHIPLELGNLSRLEKLDLSNNSLSGAIPETFGNLENLVQLFLGLNELEGGIPVFLNQIEPLKQLALGSNKLSGEIPAELGLGRLFNLEILGIGDNELTGAIPAELANLRSLQQLYLNENQLSGCFPDAFRTAFCALGQRPPGAFEIGYDFRNNPMLPWQGEFERFCNEENEIGAACDDGDATTINDMIQNDCLCAGEVSSMPESCIDNLKNTLPNAIILDATQSANAAFAPGEQIATDCGVLLQLEEIKIWQHDTKELVFFPAPYKAWEGRNNDNNNLPPGVYYYMYTFHIAGEEEARTISGMLTLLAYQ